mgnify:CR=1 FL=1
MNGAPRISVAIPLHNEAAVLPELLRRLGMALDRLAGGPHEIVLVDDGSTDATPRLLAEAAAHDPRLRIVLLSRNFGHQAALTAALDQVSGDVTVVMDGDLQDEPEVIEQMVAEYAAGYDVVYVQRLQRPESWWLRASYFVFYRLLAGLSDTHLPLDAGDFGLLSRRVVEQLRRMPEHHRYLRGLRSWVGFRQKALPVRRAARQAGESKYSAWGLFKLASDGLLAFSIVPLRAAALLGATVVGLAVLFAAYAVYARVWLHESPRGFTALTVLLTGFSGTILFFLGVIGEYLGRVYEELKARPLYVVDRVIASAPPAESKRDVFHA